MMKSQSAIEFQPDDAVGGFRILRELGRGGESRVYLAERAEDGLRVALKISPQARQEAAILERLDHQGIVTLHSWQELGSSDVLVLEHVCGPALADWLNPAHETATSLPPGTRKRRRFVYRLMAELAKAVGLLHNQGIWHLDIKPENVLLNDDGQPVLIDFSVARLATSETKSASTKLGGTLAYMSPEQLRELSGTRTGDAAVDSRSDIYALGALFYELLTGRQLFPLLQTQQGGGGAAREALAERLRPERLSSQLRILSRNERAVIARCLAPAKQKNSGAVRYPIVGEFLEDVNDLQASRSPRNAAVSASGKKFIALACLLLLLIGLAIAANGKSTSNRLDRVDQNLSPLIEAGHFEEGILSNEQIDHWEAQIRETAWIETASLKNHRLRVEHHLGMAALAGGQFVRAEQILERLLADHSDFAEAWHNLGIARFRLKNYQGAVAAFQSALEHGADRAEVLAARAAAYGAMGEFDKARADLEFAQESNPNSPAVRRQVQLWEQLMREKTE